MINELIKLATHLDAKGLKKEAEYLDAVIKRAARRRRSREPKYMVSHIDGDQFEVR